MSEITHTSSPEAVSGQSAESRSRLPRKIGGIVLSCLLAANLVACNSPHTPQQPAPPAAIGNKRPPANTEPAANPHIPRDHDFYFFYAGGHQDGMTAKGAVVEFSQEEPYVDPESHSLVELAVRSADGQQVVEVGWTVDTFRNDTQPRLFTFHWVNGKPACYDGCGFVQEPNAPHPGDPVVPGTAGSYAIIHSDERHEWDVVYNGDTMGYYPDSLWDDKFTEIGDIQAFGEVASNNPTPCTDMGNGEYGNSPGAATISNFSLLGTKTPSHLTPYGTDPRQYSFDRATPTALSVGGPGSC